MNAVASANDVGSVSCDHVDNRTRDLDAEVLTCWLYNRRFVVRVEAGCGLEEEWRETDAGQPPRLLVLEFARR